MSNNTPQRKKLVKLHFALIGVALLNFFCRGMVGTGLHPAFVLCIKLAYCLLGAVLFFMYARPFKRAAVYFGIYLFSPLLLLLAWMMDGIFGAILLTIAVGIVGEPMTPQIQHGNYVVYDKFQGFFGNCCAYDIYENKYLLLQKYRATVRIEESNISNAQLSVSNDTAYLRTNVKVSDASFKNITIVDSTIAIPLQP